MENYFNKLSLIDAKLTQLEDALSMCYNKRDRQSLKRSVRYYERKRKALVA